ncbi:MAG: GNAT family N-acetyltransferase [Cellulosilyticaceae bacterium]
MIEIMGVTCNLRTFTREEYHDYWGKYVPDPIMDPEEYVYARERVDKAFDMNKAREEWYPKVGIFLKDGTVIGDLSFKRIDREKSRCEIGLALANDTYKGLGCGTEAMQLAISYAQNTLKLNYIYADTMGSNIRMQKIFKKLGFQFLERVERCYDMDGRWEDKINYVLVSPSLSNE